MTTYQAKVLSEGGDIEEEVSLQIGTMTLTAFASVCPYAVREGHSYPVQLHLEVLNGYSVEQARTGVSPGLVRLGTGFAYAVTGRLDGRLLSVGDLSFDDEVLQRDFGHLDGRLITVKVDRIDVEFLDPQ